MLKILFQKLLLKFGKKYELDINIPSKLLYITLYKRAIMLIRGLIYLQKRVFLGKNCKLTNKKNIILGKNVTIDENTIIDGFAFQKIIINNNSKIGSYSLLTCTSHLSKYGKGLKIGKNSSVGRFTEFGAAGGIEIGDNVIMGSYVSFHSENHNFDDINTLIREQGVTSKGIKIGNNIWVGAKVTFLDGSQVGDNSVVAAGAVVKGIFPSNVIIGGVPAKILKKIQ